jgi:hypothetical protein
MTLVTMIVVVMDRNDDDDEGIDAGISRSQLCAQLRTDPFRFTVDNEVFSGWRRFLQVPRRCAILHNRQTHWFGIIGI